MRLMIISTFLFAFFTMVSAQEVEDSGTVVEAEIGGMIISDTISKIGKDFFDLFFTRWEKPDGVGDHSITIIEKLSPRQGSVITIEIDDQTVYQTFVQPRYEKIEDAVNDAVAFTQSYLINYEQIMKQLNGEDMDGSGIF